MTKASQVLVACMLSAMSAPLLAQTSAPVAATPPANDAPVVPQTTAPIRASDLKEPTRTTTYLPQNPVYNISTLDERLRQFLPNLKRPTLALMTSGQPMPQAWKNVADAGVKTVINLRHVGELGMRDEGGEVRAAGLNYIEIPIADYTELTPVNAHKLWDTLRNARGGVLVHCSTGERSAALLAIAAHREGKLSISDALEFGKKAGLNSLTPVVDAILNDRPIQTAAQFQ